MSTLATLLPELSLPPAQAAIAVQGITADSRSVRAGEVFVALKGRTRDARELIPQAIERGAVAVLAEQDDSWPQHTVVQGVPVLVLPDLARQLGEIAARCYGQPSRAYALCAVTGTNGKTSFSHLLAGAMSQLGQRAGVIGTLGNGFYGQLHEATHTTPDPAQLQRLLAQFRDGGAQVVAMEASSHGLEQGRLLGCHIHTAVFTNLTRDHLDYHGTMAAYAEAKSRLFAWPALKWAVLNADDPASAQMAASLSSAARVLRYSAAGDAQADVVARVLRPSLAGLELEVATPMGPVALVSPLMGRFNADNLLAVLATLLTLKVPLAAAAQALTQLPPVAGRMERFRGEKAPLVVVDYAHTPDALEKALDSLRPHTEGRLWCVFGCGGDRDRGKRPEMGRIASLRADNVIVTSDNPRSERAEAIIGEIMAGVAGEATVVVDRRKAIQEAILRADEHDIVLVAGKGHENYQDIAGVKYPFCDADEVRAALAARKGH